MNLQTVPSEPMTDGDKAAAICTATCHDRSRGTLHEFHNLTTLDGHTYMTLPLRLCREHSVAHFIGQAVWDSLTLDSQDSIRTFCERHRYHLHVR